jgi:hypothetical protein
VKGKELLKEFEEILSRISSKVSEDVSNEAIEESKVFIACQIKYLKNITLEVEENEKLSKLKISDTRLEKDREDFWIDNDNCLEVLLEMYLGADIWYSEFVGGVIQALSNSELELSEDSKLKN